MLIKWINIEYSRRISQGLSYTQKPTRNAHHMKSDHSSSVIQNGQKLGTFFLLLLKHALICILLPWLFSVLFSDCSVWFFNSMTRRLQYLRWGKSWFIYVMKFQSGLLYILVLTTAQDAIFGFSYPSSQQKISPHCLQEFVSRDFPSCSYFSSFSHLLLLWPP